MSGDTHTGSFRARVYGRSVRVLNGSLFLLSGASLPAIFVYLATSDRLLFPGDRLLLEARLILIFALLPFLIARLVRWATTAKVTIEADTLTVRGRSLHIEIPRSSIERIAIWTIPLPGPGLWLILRSGKRFRFGFEPLDFAAATRALDSGTATPEQPAAAYALARDRMPWRWYHLLVKFVLFPLIPGLLVFRLHQFITFGGPLGQYYLYGLRPYLETMGVFLTTTCLDCLLWASLWRGPAELFALATTRLAPHRARAIRRGAEIACWLAYYGGLSFMYGRAFLS